MNRRLTVGIAATAAVGLGTASLATSAGAAIPRNEIRMVGGTVVKPGKFLKVNMRFKKYDTRVNSGATVRLVNRIEEPEPHTITFIRKRFLPETFESGLEPQLFAAHGVNPEDEQAPPSIPVVDNGAPAGAMLNADTMFSRTVMGDSAFIFPGQKTFRFRVTADEGSRLFYYCAIHPWMQGKITVR
jgi:plastocyanin